MTMYRVGTRVCVGIAVLSLLSSGGCGPDPFGAPARSSSSPPPLAEETQTAKSVYMIVPSAPSGEIEVWSILAQREANDRKAIFRLMGPTPDQPASAQPVVIRKAVDDGASALVIVPGDSPDLAKTLAEMEANKVPVVLLGQSIAAPAGSKPFTFVDHAPVEPMAKRIVATLIEDLKKAGRPTEGTVLLISDKFPDRHTNARISSLKTALEAVGLKAIIDVSFDGTVAGSAQTAVLEAVKAHPDVILAIADEGEGIQGASQARISLAGNPAFFVGGFAGYRRSLGTTAFQGESCFVEGKVDDLARLAVATVLKKLKGEPIVERDGRVELPAVFNRGTGLVAQPVQKSTEISVDNINRMVPKPSTLPNPSGSQP